MIDANGVYLPNEYLLEVGKVAFSLVWARKYDRRGQINYIAYMSFP